MLGTMATMATVGTLGTLGTMVTMGTLVTMWTVGRWGLGKRFFLGYLFYFVAFESESFFFT